MLGALPDLDSLRCFEVLAHTVSFLVAAARMGLSPGAFSERIRRLEEQLGAPLFHRTTRRVQLTEAGHRLLPPVRRLLMDAAELGRLVVEGRPAPFEIRLGTRYELGLSWLCPALGPLREHRPERTIHLHMGDAPDLIARTERGEIDAAVLSARLTSPRLAYAVLHPEGYALVARRSEVLAADGPTLLDVSPDLPLFRYLLDALPDGFPWTAARHEYLGGIGAIRLRCLEGAGIAVLPAYFVRADLDAGRLVQLLPDVPLKADLFRLIWRAGHPLAPRLIELAEELRARPLT